MHGPGEELGHGPVAKRRLGKGATALALLVERDAREHVLKLALSPEHNDRLHAEADVLRRLRHQYIVELHEVLTFNGFRRTAVRARGSRSPRHENDCVASGRLRRHAVESPAPYVADRRRREGFFKRKARGRFPPKCALRSAAYAVDPQRMLTGERCRHDLWIKTWGTHRRGGSRDG